MNRAVSRVDHILEEIASQLNNGNPVAKKQSPKADWSAPKAERQTRLLRPVIPKEAKGIALLPLADQAAALAQRTCPVTGDLLGLVGKPFKVEVLGRAVFVCCKGCVEDIKANPGEFLARLGSPQSSKIQRIGR